MATRAGASRRSDSTPIPGPAVSAAAYRQLQDQVTDQEKALEISSLKLDMVIKQLSAMMNDALARDQLDSFDYQWKIQSLKTAGMPKEFVNLCMAYQEFCDNRHSAPYTINIAELKSVSHDQHRRQQEEKSDKRQRSPHQQPRRHRARSRSQAERQQRDYSKKHKKRRRRDRSLTRSPRDADQHHGHEDRPVKNVINLTDEEIPPAILAIRKIRESSGFLNREFDRRRSQQPSRRHASRRRTTPTQRGSVKEAAFRKDVDDGLITDPRRKCRTCSPRRRKSTASALKKLQEGSPKYTPQQPQQAPPPHLVDKTKVQLKPKPKKAPRELEANKKLNRFGQNVTPPSRVPPPPPSRSRPSSAPPSTRPASPENPPRSHQDKPDDDDEYVYVEPEDSEGEYEQDQHEADQYEDEEGGYWAEIHHTRDPSRLPRSYVCYKCGTPAWHQNAHHVFDCPAPSTFRSGAPREPPPWASSTPCRNGWECRGRRSGKCPYVHPDQPPGDVNSGDERAIEDGDTGNSDLNSAEDEFFVKLVELTEELIKKMHHNRLV